MKIILDTQNTIENLLYDNNVKSNCIYIIVIAIIVTIITLLPFIKVSIPVQGRGFIRPVSEKTEIKINQSEIVGQVYIHEGQVVKQGDTLIILRKDQLQSKGKLLESEIKKVNFFILDLQNLCIMSASAGSALVSDLYIQQYTLFNRKKAELDARIEKAAREVERNRTLFQKEIISAKVFDDLNYELERVKKERRILSSNQIAQWKADLVKYTSDKENLQA